MNDVFSQPTDQQALALTHAIALQESSSGDGKPNYNAVGDNGTSHGAYQWQPGNFESAAKAAGLDPNDKSPANQDKVAYYQVKQYKDKGYDPGQIASLWNSGSPDNWQNHSGTTTVNGKPLAYDTPAYVKGVQKYYKQLQGGTSGYNPTPYSNPVGGSSPGAIDYTGTAPVTSTKPQDQSLGGELGSRINDASQAITETTSGKQNIISGALQVAGAAAGGVGDIVNKGLELIPGVKQVENLIGQGVGALASTPGGQAVAKSIQDFSTAHPELSKDIGAGFNIITAIPILRGLGVAKDLAADGVSQALRGVAEKSANKGLTKIVSSTIGGRKALAATPDAIKTLVDERALPDIEGSKYVTKEAEANLEAKISNINDTELTAALKKANVPQTSSRVPLEQYRQEALANAKDELMSPSSVNSMFDLIKEKYGDYPTLEQMQEAKLTVSKRISDAAFGSPEASANKLVRSSLQKSIEDGANTLGLGDVKAINQKMARLIKAQNMLRHIDGKGVKTGLVGGLVQEGAAAAGEALGNTVGVPLVGAYATYKAGGFLGKKLAGISKGILDRTGQGAVRQGVGTATKKLGGLVGSALLQKANSR